MCSKRSMWISHNEEGKWPISFSALKRHQLVLEKNRLCAAERGSKTSWNNFLHLGLPYSCPGWAQPCHKPSLRASLVYAKSWKSHINNRTQPDPENHWWPETAGASRAVRSPWALCWAPNPSPNTLLGTKLHLSHTWVPALPTPRLQLHKNVPQKGWTPAQAVSWRLFIPACLLMPCTKLKQTNRFIWTTVISRYWQHPGCIETLTALSSLTWALTYSPCPWPRSSV